MSRSIVSLQGHDRGVRSFKGVSLQVDSVRKTAAAVGRHQQDPVDPMDLVHPAMAPRHLPDRMICHVCDVELLVGGVVGHGGGILKPGTSARACKGSNSIRHRQPRSVPRAGEGEAR